MGLELGISISLFRRRPALHSQILVKQMSSTCPITILSLHIGPLSYAIPNLHSQPIVTGYWPEAVDSSSTSLSLPRRLQAPAREATELSTTFTFQLYHLNGLLVHESLGNVSINVDHPC